MSALALRFVVSRSEANFNILSPSSVKTPVDLMGPFALCKCVFVFSFLRFVFCCGAE
jgi:hypothetical protein